jgi:exonuclease VII small subunit
MSLVVETNAATPSTSEPEIIAFLQKAKKVTNSLTTWCKAIESRLSSFTELENDMTSLMGHTDQLSREIEKSRPGAPSYKNAQEALKRAMTRVSKLLREQEACLQKFEASLEAPAELGEDISLLDEALQGCRIHLTTARQQLLSMDEAIVDDFKKTSDSEELKRPRDTNDSKKARDKTRKRSPSPKR